MNKLTSIEPTDTKKYSAMSDPTMLLAGSLNLMGWARNNVSQYGPKKLLFVGLCLRDVLSKLNLTLRIMKNENK